MHMQALALEHRLGRPLIPSFHGAWTAGGLAATIVTLAVPMVLILAMVPLARHFAPRR